jgi:nucleoside-diphosphate kinase
MLETTLVIVKPDGVGKKVVGKVMDRFESEGFQLLALRMVRPTRPQMEGFYAEHKGRPFFPALLEFITSGPLVVSAWRGENAVARVRQMLGATNSAEAAPGTLRKTWGTDQRRNLVHASDSLQSAARETAYFFQADELAPYDPDRWRKLDETAPSRP